MAANFGIQPSEGHHTFLSSLDNYASQATRISPKERRQLRKTAFDIAQTSPSDAYAFVAEQGRGYSNYKPTNLLGKLMTRPVDYDRFKLTGASAFQDLLGRSMSDTEWKQTSELAKTMGIRDPNVFEAYLSKRIASTPEGQAKIKTEADIAWESQYGTMPRDEQGNLVRGRVQFDPNTVNQLVNSMLGTVA
jgi:hypothetical protein